MQANILERAAPGATLTFEDSVEAPIPVAEAYQRWINFSRFPEFMENVEEVRPLGGGRYHWVARILGTKREWDTEVADQQENQRISWRSVNGPTQYGTVAFQPLPNNKTQIRLRLEYTPPGGVVGQKLEQLTQTTRRTMKRNLQNFARLVKSEREPVYGTPMRPGLRPLANALSIPIGTGLLGGIVSYALVRRRYPLATRLLLRKRMLNRAERRGAIASWVLILATLANIITTANFRRHGDVHKAVAMGQYTPALLGSGILARIIAHRALKPMLPGAVASWAFMSAAAGSIITSIIAHLRGRRNEGLFIGHWVPTFLAGAVISRLISRD
jgi:uncharacterized membrane protein